MAADRTFIDNLACGASPRVHAVAVRQPIATSAAGQPPSLLPCGCAVLRARKARDGSWHCDECDAAVPPEFVAKFK